MIAEILAEELGAGLSHVQATIALIDEGNTVPFIARYRKEITGGMDDSQIRQLETRLNYLRELEERKEAILKAIEEQGKLTEELAAEIRAVQTKSRLEDLYLPYKKTRKTKATIARDSGLEPLADTLLAPGVSEDPASIAEEYLCEGFEDTKAALAGARAIVVERIATDADLVGEVREEFFNRGVAEVGVVDGKETEGAKYRDYFDFSEPLDKLPSHRILAILRGESEGVLHVNLTGGEEDEFYQGIIADRLELGPQGDAADKFRAECVRFGWRTKLAVSSAVDARVKLKERADASAVDVFAKNLRDLLLAAPAGQRATLGMDPGYRNGVKCAVVDATGKVVDTIIVYPHSGAAKWGQARSQLAGLVAEHGVELLAVGNGTASRETEKLAREIADLIAEAGGKRPTPVIVSEAGASVYSASEVASREFPDMDVSLRGAVSIARRLQDPLAELVKIDPKSIGVGQYQHDVNQTWLTHSLDSVVEDAVNSVGVDVNSASAELLERVAGITKSVAENIVTHRHDNGAFRSRKELLKVPRLGPRAFEQSAGFLRIHDGEDPLDASAVHPEAYSLVRAITEDTGVAVPQLIGNSGVLTKLRPADYANETFGVPTVRDVLAELDKPGRDPRPSFKTASLAEGVEKVSDVRPGMVLEGTVTNVAAFGAFVDIGVHQDGLVHVSAMADRFIKDPHEVVHSGQVVKVKVMDVDVDRQRIGLSLRLSDEPGGDQGSGSGRAGRRGEAGERNSRDGRGRNRGGQRGDNRGGQRGKRGGPRGGGSQAGGAMAAALKQAGF